jgi:hypothetical protein
LACAAHVRCRSQDSSAGCEAMMMMSCVVAFRCDAHQQAVRIRDRVHEMMSDPAQGELRGVASNTERVMRIGEGDPSVRLRHEKDASRRRCKVKTDSVTAWRGRRRIGGVQENGPEARIRKCG